MPYSTLDLGGCGCGCYPCGLPASNLHFTYAQSLAGTTASGVLTYSLAAGVQTWTGCGVVLPAGNEPARSVQIQLSCNPGTGCTVMAFNRYNPSTTCTGAPFQTYAWDHPSGCAGPIATFVFYLCAWTCSPLSLEFHDAPCGAAHATTITITP